MSRIRKVCCKGLITQLQYSSNRTFCSLFTDSFLTDTFKTSSSKPQLLLGTSPGCTLLEHDSSQRINLGPQATLRSSFLLLNGQADILLHSITLWSDCMLALWPSVCCVLRISVVGSDDLFTHINKLLPIVRVSNEAFLNLAIHPRLSACLGDSISIQYTRGPRNHIDLLESQYVKAMGFLHNIESCMCLCYVEFWTHGRCMYWWTKATAIHA